MPPPRTHWRRPTRPVHLVGGSAVASLLLVVLAGCGGGTSTDHAAVQPHQSPPRTVTPVGLGVTQHVSIASSFGPGTADVPADITVYAVLDHVAPAPAIRPAAAESHWASADVQICRNQPVVLGYPAWVLGDDEGRTAQVTKVLHPQFPQPALDDGATTTGCLRGWVTWVTADALHPTQVRFEQTHSIPGAWRI